MRNNGTGEMQHGEAVLPLLLPADEDAPEAVEPAVAALYHPAPGLLTRIALETQGLFALRSYVEQSRQFARLVVVVALTSVQALGFPGLGSGRSATRASID